MVVISTGAEDNPTENFRGIPQPLMVNTGRVILQVTNVDEPVHSYLEYTLFIVSSSGLCSPTFVRAQPTASFFRVVARWYTFRNGGTYLSDCIMP